jgi:ABC-type dipeptide/oligopeptide/nickel transport system ATPase component
MKKRTVNQQTMTNVRTVAYKAADRVAEPIKAAREQPETVLQVTGLNIVSTRKKNKKENMSAKLIHGVDFSIRAGEMLALVGESGSGKSVTASAILGLLPEALQVTSGQIKLNGMDIQSLSEKERRRMRGKDMAYIFQHYESSFTPFLKIGKQLVEVIRIHERIPVLKAKQRALEWLERVRLPAERVLNSYPFQLSGGQLQRASLAAALMLKPSLIIADEPTTALDALTGEQVLDLLVQLQKETGCAVLLKVLPDGF